MSKFLDACLDKLELLEEKNTEYTFRCPLCGGDKLKVNRSTQAYECYSVGCDTKKLYGNIVGFNFFRTLDRFDLPTTKKKDYRIFDKMDLNFKNLCIVTPWEHITNELDHVTHYSYEDTLHRVTRLKKEKVIYPEYYDGTTWIRGNDGGFTYYAPFTEIFYEGTLLCVEGEKCTAAICKDEIGAFSLYQGLASNQIEVERVMEKLIKKYPFIKQHGIIYIEDNDPVGKIKGIKFTQVCNALHIPNFLLSISSLCGDVAEGYDIYDFIQQEDMWIKRIIDTTRELLQ